MCREEGLEGKSDELLAAARTKGAEYPYYSEDQLHRKHCRREARYAVVPERKDMALRELDGMAVADLLHFGERAGLEGREKQVWELAVYLLPLREIARQAGIASADTVRLSLDSARIKVAEVVDGDPFYGWFIVYLEDVLRRHLF